MNKHSMVEGAASKARCYLEIANFYARRSDIEVAIVGSIGFVRTAEKLYMRHLPSLRLMSESPKETSC